ncbi:hypothetical protein HY605_04065 [Candidatus Peregrinibacteria bacterium]|nr:hypothetical protein [Candidatus Peregrinibacteria bacterium]
MKKVTNSINVLLCVCITLSGCTGARMSVDPSPDLLQKEFPQKFASVSVKEMTPTKVYPPAGWLTQDFAREIESSGFSYNVYFPSRPDDKSDAVLETTFDVSMDPHMWKLLVKSFFIGLTFFILEPVFWYDFDYSFNGKVDVVQGDSRLPVEARTKASISMKWLSLGQAHQIESDAMRDSKQSLFRQLLDKIGKQ